MGTHPKTRLESLTGLRGYAAALVFLAHQYHFDYFGVPESIEYAVTRLGPLGVSVFFVLSGFVLIHNYSADESAVWTRRDFYVARFARVYPIFLVTTLLAAPMEALSPHKTEFWEPFLANVTVTQCFFQSTCGTFNDLSWSITVEGTFYVLFPLLVLGFRNRKWMPVVLLSGLAVVVTTSSLLPGLYGSFRFPLNRLFEFMVGMALGQARSPTWISAIARHRSVSTAMVILLTALSVLVAYAVENQPALRNVEYLLCVPFTSLLVMLLAGMDRVNNASPWFASGWAILAGEISYSFYLFHNLVMRYASNGAGMLLQLDLTEQSLPMQISISLGCFVVTVMASYGAYRWIEKPARDWIRMRLSAAGRPIGRNPSIPPVS